jgi:hypothetical protein
VLAAENTPDFRTISEFRRRHLELLSGLFRQALAQQAGLVTLGHVALDGTKIRATASEHKAMSYARLCQEEPRLAAGVAALVRRAEEADAVDDAAYGLGRSGDEVPEELRRRESRVRKIREAKAALEAQAHAQAERQRAARVAQAAQAAESAPPRRRTPRRPATLQPTASSTT